MNLVHDGYRAPCADIYRAMALAGAAPDETAADVLHEYARIAQEVLAPSDRLGDAFGARLRPDGAVAVAPEVAAAYQALVEGGWPAVAQPVDYGGGGFGRLFGTAIGEITASANLALSLNPTLTHGAIELLSRWGSAAQRERYLPPLVAGEWSGTMNMTEPDAGSDVGQLRASAHPADDGSWRVTGTKIFITWGEHDLTSNIVHLVLARTPSAPAGSGGISLFLVPKFLPDGTRNAVRCVGLESKLGIHSSPTCTMAFDGAVGELVGDECGGMRAMFTMMNAARLAIAVQGLAVGERATQQAWSYAHERKQGRAPGGTQAPSVIAEHPDVRRMLLDLRSTTRAMRLLLYSVARYAELTDDAIARRRVDVLTPVAKAWCTESGFRLASLAVQVHGGVGYIEDAGVAQLLRDSRIGPIYEGTNGIQAIDLVMRKVARDRGHAIREHLDDLARRIAVACGDGRLRDVGLVLEEGLDAARSATDLIVARGEERVADVLAGASTYLEILGVLTAGSLLVDLAARHGDDDAVVDARFFAGEHVVLVPALCRRVALGAARLGVA